MTEDIVPEGFDLQAAKAEIVNTKQTETRRCKTCNCAGLEPRNGGLNYNDKDGNWWCYECSKRLTESETYIGTYHNNESE